MDEEEGGAAAEALRCNGCWEACSSTEFSCATSCQHLYCLTCCQTILESDDPTCPICNQARRLGHRSERRRRFHSHRACRTALTHLPQRPQLLQLIQKNSIKAVHVLSSAADLALVVAGQTPKVALEVAHASIQFCAFVGAGCCCCFSSRDLSRCPASRWGFAVLCSWSLIPLPA